MKKRILTLFTAIIMVFALAACGSKATLESVLSSDEWQQELKVWNDSVASMGMSIDTVADGNTLVFEYHLPDQEAFNALGDAECSVMTDSFLNSLSSDDFISVFKKEYGVSLDAVRCAIIKADGTEIYRDEIK